MPRMLAVPEESTFSDTGNTIETTNESSTSGSANECAALLIPPLTPGTPSSVDFDVDDAASSPDFGSPFGSPESTRSPLTPLCPIERAASAPYLAASFPLLAGNGRSCRSSESTNVSSFHSKSKRSPKMKLTFVNRQFVDLATAEGRVIAFAAASSAGKAACSRMIVSGIDTSIHAGHYGIIPPSPASNNNGNSNGSPAPSMNNTLSFTGKKKNRLFSSSLVRARSDASNASVSSEGSAGTGISGNSNGGTQRERYAISSIVALGDGYFLTASKCDRVIKMWRATSSCCSSKNVNHAYNIEDPNNGSSRDTIEFVRNFVGHATGITCLAKVDDKGRFLSASKDRSVKLWDSRYNCNDDNDHNDNNISPLTNGKANCGEKNSRNLVLLATVENMDRRHIDSITIIDDGTYVRPTDDIDWAMLATVSKMTMKEGSHAVQCTAQER